jgi:hypothetical protein
VDGVLWCLLRTTPKLLRSGRVTEHGLEDVDLFCADASCRNMSYDRSLLGTGFSKNQLMFS